LNICGFIIATLEITRHVKTIRTKIDKRSCLMRTPKVLHDIKIDRLTVWGKDFER